jgi:hypothetical protein
MVQVPFSFPLRPRQPAKKKRAKKIYIRERKVIIYIHTSAQEIGRRRREKGCVYLYYYIDAKTVRMGASFFSLSLSLSCLYVFFSFIFSHKMGPRSRGENVSSPASTKLLTHLKAICNNM